VAGGAGAVGHYAIQLAKLKGARQIITTVSGPEKAAVARQAGADIIHVSTGQTTTEAKPVFGRLWQTPYSDRIRNEARVPTIAVGNITDADQVNSIIAAGRADLCAIARPHLANPAWTLAEAAKLGYGDIEWPRQYRTAKVQLERNLQREKEAAAANAGLTPQEIASKLLGS